MFLMAKLNGKALFITLTSVLALFISSNVLAHGWMAPKDLALQKNPVAMNSDSIKSGKKIYAENCAYCHGGNAKGNTSAVLGLDTDPPNLQKRIKSHSDGDFFWKIQNGRGDMPTFKDELQANEIWSIINYLRNLSK